MKLLKNDNTTININLIDEDTGQDVNYCVFEYEKEDSDYFFIPLLAVEQYYYNSVCLKINDHYIQVPGNLSILVGDPENTNKDIGGLELVNVQVLNDKKFHYHAFVFNPLTESVPKFYPIEIVDIYPNINWTIPSLKNNRILCVSLEDSNQQTYLENHGHSKYHIVKKRGPECIFLSKDSTKFSDNLELGLFL